MALVIGIFGLKKLIIYGDKIPLLMGNRRFLSFITLSNTKNYVFYYMNLIQVHRSDDNI